MAKPAFKAKKWRVIEGGAAKKGGPVALMGDPPWDDDATDTITKRVKSRDVSPKEPLYEDDDEAKAASLYKRRMARTAKRVSNTKRTYNSTATRELVVREQLASVIRLLPLAEETFNNSKSERQVYAYMALINQARELMADLQTMATVDSLAANMVDKVIEPTFTALVSFMIGEISQIQGDINNATSQEHLAKQMRAKLADLLRSIGSYAQESMEKAIEDSAKALRG